METLAQDGTEHKEKNEPAAHHPPSPRQRALLTELQAYPHFVNWHLVHRANGKTDKIPINPHTGETARVNDATTWGTYATVADSDHRGFVFTADDPFVGIDLDHCRTPETGSLEPWASEIIRALDSYTEVSPGGCGIHILCRGTLPGPSGKRGKVEMYDRGRFFTLTGNHLPGTPTTIEDRSHELAAVYPRCFPAKKTPQAKARTNGHTPLPDEDILAACRKGKTADVFTHLWSGDCSGYASQSEADLSLCGILAFFCQGDATAIDRLFRQSALYRKKWDRQDYAARTIAKALAGKTELYRKKTHARYQDNGHQPPEPELSEEEENTRIIAQERDPPGKEPEQPAYPCPDVLWEGVFAEVGEKIGKRGWEVWVGVYCALAAVAHHNLHWFYFNEPIFGAIYALLLNRTAAGKGLVINTVEDLLPQGYPVFYGVQSGPGLVPLLTDDPLDNKAGRLTVKGRPALLVCEEWSRLLQVGGIEHSTLIEDLNALFQRRRSWSQSRSHKTRSGGSLIITTPALTICGTSTIKLFTAGLSEKLLYSGYLNRYVILPGSAEWEEYTGQVYSTVDLKGTLDGLQAHAWGHGRNLREAYSDPAWAYWLDLQRQFFLPLANDPDTPGVMTRLHFYFHHIALIYAWSVKAPKIELPHAQAANQIIATSHQFLLALLAAQHEATEPLPGHRRAMGIEEKIIAKVEREPGVSKRKLMQDLHRVAGCEELGRCLESLRKAGLVFAREGERSQVFVFPVREEK
jgi:NrS-1  polymerase HBD domain